MNCPVCDTAVVAGAHFCHACGARLSLGTNPHPLTGSTETDRLPAWLKQEHESSHASNDRATTEGARPSSPRPIPDGGLAQSMPSWLMSSPSSQDGIAHNDPALASPVAPPPDNDVSPIGDQPAMIDVTGFLSADDLPAWIRRVAEPTTIGTTAASTSSPVPAKTPDSEPKISSVPPSAPAPPPESVIPVPPPAVTMAPAHPVSPEPRQVTETRVLAESKRSPSVSWHLLLLVAIVILVAIAGYTIYLVSFR